MKIRNLAWSGCLLLGAVSAHANLIVNGSFEVPDEGSGWGAYASIPGWTALTNAIEIGNAAVYGVTNHDLDQVLEPDYTSNATVEQMVGTAASQSYLLTFGVAKRAGVSAATCQIDVWWDGALLVTIVPASTVMAYYGYTVAASTSSTSLQFRGGGTPDGRGGLVDDVRLELVPEPATVATLGIGAAVLLRRRRQ